MLERAIAESLAESGGAATEGSSFGDAPEARSLGARAPSPPAAPAAPVSTTPLSQLGPGKAWLEMDKKWSASGERRSAPRKPTKDRASAEEEARAPPGVQGARSVQGVQRVPGAREPRTLVGAWGEARGAHSANGANGAHGGGGGGGGGAPRVSE